MPELPEVEALADHLRRHAVGLDVGRVDVSALSVLKTFDPPLTALHGQEVTAANRWGKYLGLQADGLHLITHLSRAGWLRWSDQLAAGPLKPGKGPIALRVHLGNPENTGSMSPAERLRGPMSPAERLRGPMSPAERLRGPMSPAERLRVSTSPRQAPRSGWRSGWSTIPQRSRVSRRSGRTRWS